VREREGERGERERETKDRRQRGERVGRVKSKSGREITLEKREIEGDRGNRKRL
jgi:hypothetical protein